MPLGPGIYDDHYSGVRLATNAQGVLLIVIGGDQGSGFSVQADALITLTIPEILEATARQIRASFNTGHA